MLFFLSQGKKKKNPTKITDASPSLGVNLPTAHELSVLMFVLKEKTRNNEHSCACFSASPAYSSIISMPFKGNSPLLTKTTVKSSCELAFLNQTAHLYFIIWSKIFLILCSRFNQNEAISGKKKLGEVVKTQSRGV